MGHQGPLRVERSCQVSQRDIQNGGGVDNLKWPGLGTDAGIFQKIPDKLLHTFYTLQGIADMSVCFGIKVPLVPPLQEGKEPTDGNQWLLQVMRGNGGKLFQFTVAPLQFRCEDCQFLLRRMSFFI